MGISLKYSVNRVSSRGPGLSLLWRSRQRFCLDQLTFWLGWMLRLFSQFSGYLLFAALSGMQEPSLPWIEHGPTRVRWWTQTTDVAPDQKQREHTLNIFFKFESEGIAKNKKSPNLKAQGWKIKLAEREGFEPSAQFPMHTLSKRAPSASRTPLRKT